MKRNILFATAVLMAGSLIAADSSAKDAVTAAAKVLTGQTNYSWTAILVVPAGSPLRPSPTTGQTEKGGYTHVSISMGGYTTEMVLKSGKAVVSSADSDGWLTPAELDSAGGIGPVLGAMARDFKAPAVFVNEFIAGSTEIKKDGDVYSSDLSEAEVKTLLTFRVGGADAPTISNAKGSVKFWIKDGTISKYETHVMGKVSFNGNDRDVDRTSATEISDVNTTKVTVPDGAVKKMNPPAVGPDAKWKM